MAGGMGLAVLVYGFGLAPSNPPINVMLIMTAVVLAASTLQTAGGMDVLVKVAEKMLRKDPKHIVFFAPFIAWLFTFMAGTGNVLYNLLPVIAEVSRETGIRPERPISISVIASQHAVPSSPISAATVAMVAFLAPLNVSYFNILAIIVPATLIGLFVGALSVYKKGLELEKDPEYLKKVEEGLFKDMDAGSVTAAGGKNFSSTAKLSVCIFLLAAVTVVLIGTFPQLRPHVTNAAGKAMTVGMTQMIEIVMLISAGLMVMFCKADPGKITSSSVFRAGMMGVVTIFGLAWMSDTWIANNLPMIKSQVAVIVQDQPYLFAIALFIVSALTHSQGATVGAMIPLGIALGIDGLTLVAMYPAVCGYFIIPSTGVPLAGVAFDNTGTTKIGKWVVNHSYILPGFVATIVSVLAGFAIRYIFF